MVTYDRWHEWQSHFLTKSCAFKCCLFPVLDPSHRNNVSTESRTNMPVVCIDFTLFSTERTFTRCTPATSSSSLPMRNLIALRTAL